MSTDERCRHGKSLDNPCDECDEERGCSLAQAPGSASPDEVREALERSVKLQYCERCKYPNDIATGHVLTVHHLDGNKANCADWNSKTGDPVVRSLRLVRCPQCDGTGKSMSQWGHDCIICQGTGKATPQRIREYERRPTSPNKLTQ